MSTPILICRLEARLLPMTLKQGLLRQPWGTTTVIDYAIQPAGGIRLEAVETGTKRPGKMRHRLQLSRGGKRS